MNHVLVTGGAGFIGSHLVDRLAGDGCRVVVFDNLHHGSLRNLDRSNGRFTFIPGDVRDRAAIERAMHGIDLVYHLAAQSNVMGAVKDIDYSFTTNMAGTFEVLRAARDAGVRRLVFSSSREVYGDPQTLPVSEDAPLAPKNPYGASKAAGEMYCHALAAKDFDVVVLRLSNTYGNRDRDRVIPLFVRNALRNEDLTLYGGCQVIDFVAVETVVASLLRVADLPAPDKPINIGSGKPTTVRQLAERILSETGSQSKLHILPAREVEVARYVASTARMRKILGIRPAADPLDKLRDVIGRSGVHEDTSITGGEDRAVRGAVV